jgi:hypothetical protein
MSKVATKPSSLVGICFCSDRPFSGLATLVSIQIQTESPAKFKLCSTWNISVQIRRGAA